jgi:hypothetical protein
MTVQAVHQNFTNFYNHVDKIAKENPLASIIYSVALKILSTIICAYSCIVGATVFLLSFMFDLSIISNSKDIFSKIQKKFNDTFNSPPSYNSVCKPSGYYTTNYSTNRYYKTYYSVDPIESFLTNTFYAIDGFLNGLFY